MCGINGYISSSGLSLRTILSKMNKEIHHRGPDQDGFFIHDDSSVGMAMRRLSIVDLKTGSQPIYNEDKSLVIVFNGEIYNFRQLKNELEFNGVKFKTTTDTEVILKLYELYGVESFNMLDGMFAFSIYDEIKGLIVIARDFFGEKPLYFTQTNNAFIWASELKSIIAVIPHKPKISKKGLNLFFRLTYIPAPYTIYDSIHKLEANSYLIYDIKTASYSINKIHPENENAKQDISFKDAKNNIYNLVNKSVESRSYADVDVGTFLSGGVDSSIVSLLLSQQNSRQINTFSIGFEKKSFDESDKSRIVAKLINSKHREFVIGENDLGYNLEKILLNFDEPFADSSAIPSYIVAQKTSNDVKVALTGDGGDEIFGGYNKYSMGAINNKYTRFVPEYFHTLLKNTFNSTFRLKSDNRGLLFKMQKVLNAIDFQDDYYWNIISLGFGRQNIKKFLLPSYQESNIFKSYQEVLNIDKIDTLSSYRKVDKLLSLEGDMLVKVDRTSMLTSIETRAPFLNKQLWDYTFSLPDEYLMKGNDKKKFILKKAFEHEFPRDFLNKPKKGFGVPVGDWLRSSLRSELEKYIEYSYLEKQNIFNPIEIRNIVLNHLEKKLDNTFQVWTFYCFQKWYSNTY